MLAKSSSNKHTHKEAVVIHVTLQLTELCVCRLTAFLNFMIMCGGKSVHVSVKEI